MGNICKNESKPKVPKENKENIPITKRNKHCVTTQHMDLDDHSIFLLISENKIPSKIKEHVSPIEKIKSALNFLSFALSNSESNLEIFKMAAVQIIEPILEEIHENSKLLSKFWSYFLAIVNQAFLDWGKKWVGAEKPDSWLFFTQEYLVPSLNEIEEGFWKMHVTKTIHSLELTKSNRFLLDFIQGFEEKFIQHTVFQFEDSLNEVSLKLEKSPKDLKLQFLRKNISAILSILQNQDKQIVLDALHSHRFDKNAFKLPHTLISAEDGGFFYLLNTPTPEEIGFLKAEDIPPDYLEKITTDPKTGKMVIGQGGCGKIRLSLALTINQNTKEGEVTMHIGEVLCVKKSKHFGLSEDDVEISLSEIRTNVWNDYFVGSLARYLHSPNVYDVLQVDLCRTNDNSHKKGYTFQQFMPINDGNIFKKKAELQTWRHQKKYLLDIMTSINELLDRGVCMTDLKPGNTLYDSENMRARLIDLAGVVRKRTRKDLESCKLKYVLEYTPDYTAPEIKNDSEGTETSVDLCKAICFNFGVMLDRLVFKAKVFDCLEKEKLRNLYFRLIKPDPAQRIELKEAIEVLKAIGEDNLEKNTLNINEFMKSYKRYLLEKNEGNAENLENFSLNKEIQKLKELYLEAKVCEFDPEKYVEFEEEDINPLISRFFSPENSKDGVFLLMGASGSGKSTVLQIKFLETLEKWQPGAPIPFYMNLASEQNLKKRWRFLNEELVRKCRLEFEAQFSLFSGILSHPMVLFLDGFDEGRIQINLVRRIFEDLGFNAKNKIIVTCRSNYLHSFEEIQEKFKVEEMGLMIRYITPLNLNKTDLKGYLLKFLSFEKRMEHMEDYDSRFESEELRGFTKTNFMFHLVLEVLPQFKQNEPLSNYRIYEKYVRGRLNNENSKLAKVIKESIREEYKLGNNNEALFDLAEELARDLASRLFSSRKVVADSVECFDFFLKFKYCPDKPFKSQNLFTLCKMIDIKLEIQGKSPKETIKLGFSHDSIKLYFLANKILKDLQLIPMSVSLLSQEILNNEVLLIQFLSENIKTNENLIDNLKTTIFKTRKNKDLSSSTASSNAMTLLTASNVTFIQQDLSSLVLRNADIRGGLFTGSDFSHSDLTNADMSHCKLQHTTFKKTNLKDIKLGLFHPDIPLDTGVLCMEISKNGQEFVCGCSNFKIIHYSRAKSKRSFFKKAKAIFTVDHVFEGHTASVKCVSFSPDEKLVLSSSCDETIKVWHKNTGKLIKTLKEHFGWVTSAYFSADAKIILSSGTDHMIRLWDYESEKVIRSADVSQMDINSCCFSPNESYILTAGKDRILKLWKNSSLDFVRSFEGHTHFISKATFSPDGREIISTGYDQILILWETETGQTLRKFTGHTYWVHSVCFSPDGIFILSAGSDKSVKLWEKKSGKVVKSFEGHSSEIKAAIFSKNGEFILSAGTDKTIKLWETSSKKTLKTYQGHSQGVYFTSFSQDGLMILSTGNDNSIKLWDSKKANLIKTLNGHSKWVNSAFFSRDSEKILSASADTTVKLWEVSTGKCIRTMSGHINFVNFASFSSDETLIVSCGEDFQILIWETLNGSTIRKLENAHEYPITCVYFSPDDKLLLSSGNDEKLKLWESNSGNLLREFSGHTNSIKSCCFSSNGKNILSCGVDGSIRIWEVESGNLLKIINGHEGIVNSCSFSPNGKLIVSAGDDKSIRIWDFDSGKEIYILEGHRDCVFSARFSYDGVKIVSGSEDKTVKVWEKIGRTEKGVSREWILTKEMASGESGLLCGGMMVSDCLELSQLNEGILMQRNSTKINME